SIGKKLANEMNVRSAGNRAKKKYYARWAARFSRSSALISFTVLSASSFQLSGTLNRASMGPFLASALPRASAEARSGRYHRRMAGHGTAPTDWDVAVIGAGIIGCAVAREL